MDIQETLFEFREYIENLHKKGISYTRIENSMGLIRHNLYVKLRLSKKIDADFYKKFLTFKNGEIK